MSDTRSQNHSTLDRVEGTAPVEKFIGPIRDESCTRFFLSQHSNFSVELESSARLTSVVPRSAMPGKEQKGIFRSRPSVGRKMPKCQASPTAPPALWQES
jgi:hypothetical protein